jgi:hypothetical protein
VTWDNILFYSIFIGQIYVISYYYPGRLLDRMNQVLETYPPSKYPRLYPKSIEYYKMGILGFKIITRSIFALGLLIAFLMIMVVDHSSFADDGFISEAWPAFYGMLQFLPLLLLELTEFSHYKLMRQANVDTTRKATLHRRRLLDFVSPLAVGAAVFLYLTAIIVDLYVHEFTVQWGHDTVQRALLMTLTYLLLAGIGAWNLYGRKLDPHQSLSDRALQISASLHSMLFVSMAMSVYVMTTALDDAIEMGFLDATLMSLYFQVIVYFSIGHVLRSMRLENIDFNVYKENQASEMEELEIKSNLPC